jgi:peptide/nickel transport system permease protein
MTRAAMLEVLSEDYVRTARAKGLAQHIVVGKHALRNALIPIVTVIGLYMGVTLGGSVLTETVFNRPGLGRFMVGAILKRDYTIVQSAMVIYAGFVVLVNLAVDLTYGLFDPKIRFD